MNLDDSLAAGATGSTQVTVQPASAGKLTNLFQVFGDQPDPILANNVATISSTVTNAAVVPASADLSLRVTESPYPVDVGSNLVSLTLTRQQRGAGHGDGCDGEQRDFLQHEFLSQVCICRAGEARSTNGILLLPTPRFSSSPSATTTAQINATAPSSFGTASSSIPANDVWRCPADQNDPVPNLNNLATVGVVIGPGLNVTTTSTRTLATNLTASGSQRATNYSTQLIAVMPGGAVVYNQTFAAPFSNGAIQAAVAQAAQALTNAGAGGFTGPTNTSSLQTFQGNSSASATNPVGTNIILTVTSYVGPTNVFVGTGQTFLLTLPTGFVDIDSLFTTDVTNLVTTTITSNYLNSAVYVMTGIVAQASADLLLTVRVSSSVGLGPQPPPAFGLGSNVEYTLEIDNLGPSAATGIMISNRIPANATFVSADGGSPHTVGSIVPTNGVLWINIGSLPTNTATFADVILQPAVAGNLTNVFAAYGNESDPDPTNNIATQIITVTNPPIIVDVALSLVGAPNPVAVGAPLTYSLTVTNKSSTTATEVMVSNVLPAGVTFNSALPSQGSATNQLGVVTYSVGSLTNGHAATLAIVVVPNAAGLLTNTASATSVQTDSQPANNNVTNVTSAVSQPITNLVLTVLSPITLNPLTGLYEQRIQVSNGGPATPASVRVLISGLAANATLYNASGTTNGVPYVQSSSPLGVGSNIIFLLEYYVPTRVAPSGLTLTVQAGPVVIPPVVTGTILNIDRTIVQGDGSVAVEFSAVPGQIYAVQYSADMMTWRTAVPAITAPTSRVQWIDAGPPKTDSNPAGQPARYYRVILLPAH